MDNIDGMPAGRGVDALVAEKAMGYRFHQEPYANHLVGFPKGMMGWVSLIPDGSEAFGDIKTGFPSYSANIAAAFEVVEKLRTMGLTMVLYSPFSVDSEGQGRGNPNWECEIENFKDHTVDSAEADTAALAICRAVLKALDLP